MSVTQYIGARYVPLFAEPDQWSSERAYEPLTIVLHEGNSYTSKQAVPIGIDILNTEFWACTGNYNAQVEAYRREVQEFAGDIEAAQTTANEAKEAVELEAAVRETADADLQAAIDNEAAAREAADTDLQAAIDNEAAAREAADTALRNEILAMKKHAVIIGDSYSATGYGDVTAGNHWWNIVCKQLNITPHSYARGGTGFISQYTPLFNTQINSAAADSSFANADVSHMFIFGGRNDMKTGIWNQANFSTAITTALRNAKTNFPNAQIFLIGINTWLDYTIVDADYNKTDFIATKVMHDYAIANGVAFINTLGALAGSTNYFASDNHPNTAGQAVIAGYILSALNGNVATPPYKTFNISTTNGDNPQNLAITMVGGKLRLSGIVTMPSDGILTMGAPYGTGIFNYATQFAGISNDAAHELYYFMKSSDPTKIEVRGTASKRITLMGELALPLNW